MIDPTEDVLVEVHGECNRQDTLWGEQNHAPEKWLAILLEEAGEAAKAFLDGERANYREELVQVAAVAVTAIESLDRKKGG